MGNYTSCCVVVSLSSKPKTAKLINSQGNLRQVSLPVKAAELMIEELGHVISLVDDQLKQRSRTIAMRADEELLPGKVYLSVPLSKVNCKISAPKLAIIEATIAACARRSSKKRSGSTAKVLPAMAVDLKEEENSEGEVKVFEGNYTSSTSYRQWTLALEPIPEEF
uniref:Uncharacterized protein n=1 Tax=Salix viminalis TaxID=40686 RepID=A0A6N2KZJ1_SALVM